MMAGSFPVSPDSRGESGSFRPSPQSSDLGDLEEPGFEAAITADSFELRWEEQLPGFVMAPTEDIPSGPFDSPISPWLALPGDLGSNAEHWCYGFATLGLANPLDSTEIAPMLEKVSPVHPLCCHRSPADD
jgi:hypothetical protein